MFLKCCSPFPVFIFTIFDVKTVKTMFLHITWLSCFFVFFFFMASPIPHREIGFPMVFPMFSLQAIWRWFSSWSRVVPTSLATPSRAYPTTSLAPHRFETLMKIPAIEWVRLTTSPETAVEFSSLFVAIDFSFFSWTHFHSLFCCSKFLFRWTTTWPHIPKQNPQAIMTCVCDICAYTV